MGTTALAVMSDLMFKSRVMAVARQQGSALSFAMKPTEAVAQASTTPPDVVLLDLNHPAAFDTAVAVRQVAPGARYVGFYSHVETKLKRHADAVGIEPLPRSSFVEQLPGILSDKK